MTAKKIEIGVLISGGGSNLQAIVDACEGGRIDGRVVFAGSDAPGAGGLERAEKHGIPSFVVDYPKIVRDFNRRPENVPIPSDFHFEEVFAKQNLFPPETPLEKVRGFLESRACAEARLLENMAGYRFDLLALAGFMRTLTPYFIDRVHTDREKPKIMNIHPALLPAFPGVDGYGDTFRYGCKVGGCTVHFVDYGEDTGPIIGQKAFEILPGETLEEVREKGLRLEWQLYPACVQLFAEDRLRIVKKHFAVSGKSKIRWVVEIAQ